MRAVDREALGMRRLAFRLTERIRTWFSSQANETRGGFCGCSV